ncbi:helix-turn-helix domain-containing protein [Kitasatospora brasiliensis]|uniref:helix-turn-helix domain-containing protein n=1 Tax=Kitasatospora brasiliensis TaxID=3058040 RepID=UPI00292DC76B|nr:transcriptional regulator [Kitasatospora sp. K002]
MPDQLRDDMREARRVSGMGWAEFARMSGFGVPYLRNVENGNRRVTEPVATAYDQILKTGGKFAAALADAAPADIPWNQAGATLAVLTSLMEGRRVDRRGFLAAGVALSASTNNWATAISCTLLEPRARAVDGSSLIAGLEGRLDHLRHVDDALGSGEVYMAARSDLALAVAAIKSRRYQGDNLSRMYAIAAEAARQVGWSAFDQGRFGVAQSYFDASLRASAECGDAVAGAYTLSFAAIQCYSSPGLANRAVSFVDTARSQVRGRSTPRMEAMLAARAARAWSKDGAKEETKRELHLARAALDKGRREGDPNFLYWVDYGEVEMIAGSSALDLGDPAEALRCFEAGMQAYPGDEQYPRSHAIYLSRAAEAHLALHDLDAAVATGRHAAACLGSVDSARSASQLRGLREKLAPHRAYAGVRDFLDAGQVQKLA